MGLTTRTEIPNSVDALYDRTLLTRALPVLLHNRWGQEKPLPQKAGTKTVRFRRYNALATNTTELAEGVTPAGKKLSVTDLTATIKLYGDYVEITDEVDMFSADPVFTEAAELLGEQSGQSLDILGRDIINAGTNVYYSGTAGARNAVVDLIDTEDFDRIIRFLQSKNAKTMTPNIRAGQGQGTRPVRRAYWGIMNPDILFTADNLVGWQDVSEYPVADGQMDEVGSYKDLRFCLTTFAKVFAGAGGSSTTVKNTAGTVDVYSTLILAREAYGVTRVAGKALQNIRKSFEQAGGPLNQRATSGWKANFIAKILQDDFMIRLESAAAL